MTLRRLAAAILAAATLAVPVTAVTATVAPAPAAATTRGCKVTSTPEAISRDFIAAQRKKAKVRALTHKSDLREVARAHAMRMCNANKLYHNPNLTTHVKGWRIVAENVGRGPKIERINTAFMNSPGHKRNILNNRLTQFGVGVARDSTGRLFVVQNYRTPM